MDTKINKSEDIDKANPFRVPENYFEQFNREIMDKLPEKEIQKPQRVSMWDKVKPWIYMAAMFLGLYFTINFLTKNAQNSQAEANSQTLAANPGSGSYWSTVQVSEEEFYQYLENQLVEDGYYDYMYNAVYVN